MSNFQQKIMTYKKTGKCDSCKEKADNKTENCSDLVDKDFKATTINMFKEPKNTIVK